MMHIVLFLLIQSAFPITCPHRGILEDYVAETSGKRYEFCRINYKGSIVNHGPFNIYSPEGKIIEQRQYHLGKQIEENVNIAPPVKETPKK